jgi:hypothetical protein
MRVRQQREIPMAASSRVRTTPRSRASATARSLSGNFGPPARRSASARSRSRLRVLADCGRDGLLTRTVFPTTPQRVDYELTKRGSTLWEAVEPLSLWARAHVSEILKSREQFDEKILGSGKHPSLPLRSRSARASVNNRAHRPDPQRSAR